MFCSETAHPFSSSYHHHLPRERWVAVLSLAHFVAFPVALSPSSIRFEQRTAQVYWDTSPAGAPSSRGLAPCIPLSPLAMDTTLAQEDANDSFRINALGFGITPWNGQLCKRSPSYCPAAL